MQIKELITESRVPGIRNQIIADVKKHGGSADQYFVRFTDTDKLGYSAHQTFGHFPDVGDPDFDVDRIKSQSRGRRVLWFYPLNTYLKGQDEMYGQGSPYAWLVKLKPEAWLQTVKRGDVEVKSAPQGKERVGILRMSEPPAALFFKPGYHLIGRYYDYAGQHQRHGEVRGRPAPSFFDRVRGFN